MRYNYNLSGSSRRPLVEAVSQILDKPAIYQGAPSFAYMIGDYTVDRNGVLSYSNTIHPDFAAVLVSDLRERGFIAATISDAADNATANHATDAEPVVENPVEADNSAAAEAASVEEDDTADMTVAENIASAETVNPESPDILTIEVPNTGFTPETKENLKKIVASKKTVLEKALETDGLPIVEKDDKITFPWFTFHGLEGEAEAYGCLVAAICKMAKEQKRVTATEKSVENAKFTMRLFLIRLGFIGDEYKTARKILLRNLTGNSSWKSGHKPERDAATLPDPEAAVPSTEQELVALPEEVEAFERVGNRKKKMKETMLVANNGFPSLETVERVRKIYPKGTRVELVQMDDPYSRLRPGDQGTVRLVDDTGTIFVDWDSGSGLGIVYGIDRVKKL